MNESMNYKYNVNVKELKSEQAIEIKNEQRMNEWLNETNDLINRQ